MMVSKCHLDFEMDKKHILEQRKKTRLLQVRQQAKDFARKVRENVLLESICQQKRVIENRKRKLFQERKEKLNHLEEIYQSCLENVGEGHKNAIIEPNINEIKKADAIKNAGKASERGKHATKTQIEHEAMHRQKREAPIIMKKSIRTRENFRSCIISSLPKPEKNQKHFPHIKSKNSKRSDALKQQAKNLSTSNPAYKEDVSTLQSYDKDLGARDKYQPVDNSEHCEHFLTKVQDDSNQCLCAHLVCCCHSNFSGTTRRRCYSESICSVESSVAEPVQKSYTKRTRLRSRSCSPRVVKTLNYTDAKNLYECKQPSLVNVIRHQDNVSKAKVEDINDTVNRGSVNLGEDLRKEELKRKTEERCAKALNREQLKKDFQQLISDLGKLSRNRLLLKNKNNSQLPIQREREIEAKNKIKQAKLTEAFENLLNSEKTPAVHNNYNSKPSHHTGEDWSPPTLNLAAYSNYYHHQNTKSADHQNNCIKNQQGFLISDQQLVKEINNQTDSFTDRENSDSIEQQMSSRSSPRNRDSRSQSPCSPGTKQSELSRKNGESGKVIIQVRVEGERAHKKKCRKSRSHHAQLDSSTSYYSPPENLTPSQQRLLDALLTQVNKKTISEDLKAYINTLLSMSRESIEELNVSTSSSTCCEGAKSPKESSIQEDMLYLSSLTERYADKVSELVDMFERIDSPELPDCYMDPPRTLQSHTMPAAPMSPCPPPASPTFPSGAHISSHCQFCQPTSESKSENKPESKRKMRPKTPPPRPRQHRTQVKHGQQTGMVSGAEYDCNPMDSNFFTDPTPPRVQSPDHPSGYSAQYTSMKKPCSSDHPSGYTAEYPSNKPPCPPNLPSSNSPQYPCPPKISSVQKPQNQSPSGSNPGASSSSYRTRDIQTPFSLSSNLLPHPKEVFGQQGTLQTGLPTISERSEGCLPCPDNPPGHDDSMRWLFEIKGIPPPPPSNLDPVKLAEEYRRELMPDQETIRTPNSSFDMDAFLRDAERRIMQSGQQERPVTADNLCQSEKLVTGPDSDDSAVFLSTSALADMKQDDATSGSEDNLRDCAIVNTELDALSREKILSPVQLRNLRHRISEVCFEHRTRIAEYLLNNSAHCEIELSD